MERKEPRLLFSRSRRKKRNLIILSVDERLAGRYQAFAVLHGDLRFGPGPAGSYLALTHATFEGAPAGILEQISQLYSRSTASNKVRTPAQIKEYFSGLVLVEPGLVPLPLWRPDGPDDLFLQEPGRSFALCAIGKVP